MTFTDSVVLGLGPSRSPVSQVPNGILGQEKEVSFTVAILPYERLMLR
jgi:hypothetical protein